jgi:opacity protein-like surface antigen
MKKISFIKAIITMSFCLIISITLSAQKNSADYNGWSISLHTGTAANNTNLHLNNALQVNQVSNLLIYNTMIVVPATSFKVPDTSTHNTGVAISFRVGYKKTIGHLVLGAEAGVGINSFKASQTATFYPETILQSRNPLTVQQTISSGLSKMLDGKVGYITGNHLVYAIGGLAFNPVTVASSYDYKLSFRQPGHMAGTVAAASGSYNYTSIIYDQKEVHTLMGMSWGVGYQYMVSTGISVGVEYRQTGFGKGSYSTSKVTGEQAINDKGESVGVAAGIEASNISVNMKQQALTIKVDVALSAIFK